MPNTIRIKKNAALIAKDEKDARRIENVASRFHGTYKRGDTFIVKNGAHNLCRSYLVDNSNFAPWIVQQAPGHYHIGLYIAEASSSMQDIFARMRLIADIRRLPRNISDVVVLRNKNLGELSEHIRRAEDALGIVFTLIHDETGAGDEHAVLRSDELCKVSVPFILQGTEYACRFKGKIPEDAPENLESLYLHVAAQVCAGFSGDIEYVLDELHGAFTMCDPEESKRLVEAFTCGRECCGISSYEYNSGHGSVPTVADNASLNLPYEYADKTAFIFPSSDGLLQVMKRQAETVAHLQEVKAIWDYVDRNSNEDKRFGKLRDALNAGENADAAEIAAMFDDIANDYGIASMIDSLYLGVPLDDIIA